MKEKNLRQVHRTIGIILAIFIILQSATGLVMSVEDLLGKYWGSVIHDIHYPFNHIGYIYRIVLGVGFLCMAVSGVMIYIKIRKRTLAARLQK
ncbi:hypothetical protein ES703_125383 [subsurface metagenome]